MIKVKEKTFIQSFTCDRQRPENTLSGLNRAFRIFGSISDEYGNFGTVLFLQLQGKSINLNLPQLSCDSQWLHYRGIHSTIKEYL